MEEIVKYPLLQGMKVQCSSYEWTQKTGLELIHFQVKDQEIHLFLCTFG